MFTTVDALTEIELAVERSRFIAAIARADDVAAAEAFISERRARHHDARHNCWAYLIDGKAKRRSDDGEPSGTAGVPMLNVLERRGLAHVVAVVTRYFGGVLLGAGRLARTYGQATAMAVDAATLVTVVPMTTVALTAPYSLTGVLERWLERRAEVRLLSREYGVGVRVTVELPSSRLEACRIELDELGIGEQEEKT